jgi:hypothetical protein
MVLDGVSLSALEGFPSSGVDKILLVLFVAVVGSFFTTGFCASRRVRANPHSIRVGDRQ